MSAILGAWLVAQGLLGIVVLKGATAILGAFWGRKMEKCGQNGAEFLQRGGRGGQQRFHGPEGKGGQRHLGGSPTLRGRTPTYGADPHLGGSPILRGQPHA